MAGYNIVKINRKARERLESGHPWVFASDVADRGGALPGDIVRIADPAGNFFGVAHYSSTSQISLRLLSRQVEPIDHDFFIARISQAQEYRDLVVSVSDAYRLVFGEADFLPGLVVDRYADCFVIQTLSQGMDRAQGLIVECIEELYKPRAIVARNDAAVRERESLPVETRTLRGHAGERAWIQMNGLSLAADLIGGQKTGVFLDQRENYRAAERWARGRALDCFTSTGGFALHIAPRCERVEAVDSSESALAIAAENQQANSIRNIDWREANAFDVLAGHAAAGRSFETIILDPPAFAKSRANIDSAARGYKEINLRALKLLSPGGVLVTCSCSHHFSEAMLLEVIAEASLDARRQIRVLERRTQALDHPVLLTVPETHYLKCLILQCL